MKKILILWLITLLAACSADIDDYQAATPNFDLFGYFEGESQAWGMIQDYTDKQTRRFTVDLFGTVEENTLTLVEDFVFDDGEKDQRIWVITREDDGSYIGRADDIVGEAMGVESGNALHWRYDFLLEFDGSTVEVHFDDWLYRQDEKHVFNRTSIRKFGIEVAEVTIFFQK
ncbi:DUF3833 domain-containing protein [Vibrio nigripulchritudo]|uniref:DUF3833 domain-containing protein n=1 Tax=Vibrio nigripulchritudo TaxID=28173 RepID=UPI0024931172|nr:DUF3833 domain-containing protein [Vibrio nigripulchritudo]BDU36639.1 hypothetical protein TUMSATVNIG2_11080 [Vibrio nigripulchritudo]BDU42348.1 hypothetical protein TUMSATVNIG3_11460 [Vibrio nigripulchritudo]